MFIITILICGLTGYFTNWIAIKMIFRPHREITFMKIKLPFTPGLLVKERKRLAKTIGEMTEKNLLTEDVLYKNFNDTLNLNKFLNNIKTVGDLLKLIDIDIDSLFNFVDKNVDKKLLINYINNFIDKESYKIYDYLANQIENNIKLKFNLKKYFIEILQSNVNKLLLMAINKDSIYEKLEDDLIKYLKDEEKKYELNEKIKNIIEENINSDEKAREIINYIKSNMFIKENIYDFEIKNLIYKLNFFKEKLLFNFINKINVKKIVEDQINSLDILEIENIILDVAKKELNYITILGGILGALMGIILLLFDNFIK